MLKLIHRSRPAEPCHNIIEATTSANSTAPAVELQSLILQHNNTPLRASLDGKTIAICRCSVTTKAWFTVCVPCQNQALDGPVRWSPHQAIAGGSSKPTTCHLFLAAAAAICHVADNTFPKAFRKVMRTGVAGAKKGHYPVFPPAGR